MLQRCSIILILQLFSVVLFSGLSLALAADEPAPLEPKLSAPSPSKRSDDPGESTSEPSTPGFAGAYEHTLITDALFTNKLTPEPNPVGKTIEKIVITTRAVVDDADPWPLFMNLVHQTTVPGVVARELLFKTGDRWETDHVYESERNLRNYLYFAVAKIVPAKGSTPNQVIAVIVSKDLWSLRLATDYSFVGSKVERFYLEIQEQNFFGRNKQVMADLGFNLATFTLGEQIRDPRLLGSRLAVNQRFDVIINRQSGNTEGYVAELGVEKPLFSLDTKWAWAASANYRYDISRLFSNQQIAQFEVDSTGESVPYLYRRQLVDLMAEVTRSYGRDFKQNVSVGWKGYVRRFEVPTPSTPVSQATLDSFRQTSVPRTENAGLVYLNYQAYAANFVMQRDIHSFALTEDFRVGPTAELEFRLANRAFGFDQNYFEPVASLGWTWISANKNIFSLGGSAARHQPSVRADHDWVSQIYSAQIREISPPFFSNWLRLHAYGRYTRRFQDLNATIETMGGDTTLRGFPSGYLRGSQILQSNLELRTRSVKLSSMQIGAAFYHDAASAFDNPQDLHLYQSVGTGLRVLFPAFNRSVMRFDIAMPLEATPGATPAYFVTQFGQAF